MIKTMRRAQTQPVLNLRVARIVVTAWKAGNKVHRASVAASQQQIFGRSGHLFWLPTDGQRPHPDLRTVDVGKAGKKLQQPFKVSSFA